MNNFKKTIAFLYYKLPVYQKVGEKAIKYSLDNSFALDKHLYYPHTKYSTVHVAGTNGKGSTAKMIAAVLIEAGYKVGIYSSPHLKDFRERIFVNEKKVSKKYVIDFVDKNRHFIEKLSPSFFEITVAMAYSFFAYKKIDIAIVEVGLGGSLDSTNIIQPILSVITNIGLDHTKFLGNNLSNIAMEKAGIFKKETPIIIGETHTETVSIFKNFAKKKLCPIVFADQHYAVKPSLNKGTFTILKHNKVLLNDLYINLHGNYQQKNLLTAIASLDYLSTLGFPFGKNCYYKGFRKIALKGRWQILRKKPLVIVDIAHNTMGLRFVFQQIKKLTFNELHIIFGLSDGKNLDKIFQLLPKYASYSFVKAKNIKRGISTSTLAKYATKHKLHYRKFSSTKKAYEEARNSADKNDLIIITGSTFIVAEII